MKKVLLAMSAAFILYACGGSGDKPAEVKKDSPATAEAPKPSPAANSEKILTLIAEKNCAPTCHTIEKKVIGPAYIDVSKKYEATPANIEMLANKVIKGGSGVWGEVPMTPNNITLDEAKEIVTYILNLKNTQ